MVSERRDREEDNWDARQMEGTREQEIVVAPPFVDQNPSPPPTPAPPTHPNPTPDTEQELGTRQHASDKAIRKENMMKYELDVGSVSEDSPLPLINAPCQRASVTTRGRNLDDGRT